MNSNAITMVLYIILIRSAVQKLKAFMDVNQRELFNLYSWQDLCGQINPSNANFSKVANASNRFCRDAYIGWESLDPSLQSRCPQAKDPKCQLQEQEGERKCTVSILDRAKDHATTKRVELAWCVENFDWDSIIRKNKMEHLTPPSPARRHNRVRRWASKFYRETNSGVANRNRNQNQEEPEKKSERFARSVAIQEPFGLYPGLTNETSYYFDPELWFEYQKALMVRDILANF